jgi:hypothetical protein
MWSAICIHDNPDMEPGIILPEDIRPSTELAASWLDGLLKNQESLRQGKTYNLDITASCRITNLCNLVARPKTLAHLVLKYPEPGRVLDGQVLGTQVCHKSAIISLETSVLYRRTSGSKKQIELKTRCVPCNARFVFDEFLRTNSLDLQINTELRLFSRIPGTVTHDKFTVPILHHTRQKARTYNGQFPQCRSRLSQWDGLVCETETSLTSRGMNLTKLHIARS